MEDWEFDFERMVVYRIEDAYPNQSFTEQDRQKWLEKPIEQQNVYLLLRKGPMKSNAIWKDFKQIPKSYLENRNKEMVDHADGMELVKDMVQSKFDWNENAAQPTAVMVRNFKDNFDKVRKTMLELPLNYVWKWNNADQGEPKNFVTYGPDPDCKKYSIIIEQAYKESSPK